MSIIPPYRFCYKSNKQILHYTTSKLHLRRRNDAYPKYFSLLTLNTLTLTTTLTRKLCMNIIRVCVFVSENNYTNFFYLRKKIIRCVFKSENYQWTRAARNFSLYYFNFWTIDLITSRDFFRVFCNFQDVFGTSWNIITL